MFSFYVSAKDHKLILQNSTQIYRRDLVQKIDCSALPEKGILPRHLECSTSYANYARGQQVKIDSLLQQRIGCDSHHPFKLEGRKFSRKLSSLRFELKVATSH